MVLITKMKHCVVIKMLANTMMAMTIQYKNVWNQQAAHLKPTQSHISVTAQQNWVGEELALSNDLKLCQTLGTKQSSI